MDASLHQRIDFQRLSNNLGNKRETIQKMLDMYLTHSKKTLFDLETAIQENNYEKWVSILHSLKGASQNITAKRIVVLCLEGEEIKELPHERSKSLTYHMHKELEILRDLISRHFNRKQTLL